MNEQTIEMQIHTKAQQAIADMNKILSSLNLTKNGIDKVTTTIDKNGNKATKVLSSIQKEGQGLYKIIQKIDKDGSLKTVSTSMNNLKSSTDKAVNSASKLTNILSLGGAYLGAKKVTKQILSGLKASMDYSEALNLFNVVFENIDKDGKTVFSSVGKEAIQFQNQLNEAFGTNKQQTLTYHALYQSMAENMGIVSDKAGVMSKNTVKLINDLSSLYNKPEESVSTALSSGIYAGQVRPLRTYGIDITEKSLQPVLESLGIDRTVRELSQAEKQILRYIAVIRQSSVAHADWSSTIESPSNQLKILGNQAKEATVYVSSLFIGTFSKILPYANAFLMVVKEISKAIATMFGIELKDFNSGIASQEGVYDGVADSVDNATKKVKELKRQTLGFDEIHNINENKDTGSGTAGVSGGIDQRLLDAIKGYDNGMDKVRMKATDIRDKIMEWLGFTKEVNPLTGEIGFKYQGIKVTLNNMWTSFKKLNTQGKILVGLGLVTGAVKLLKTGKNLVNVFGSSGLGKTIGYLFSPMRELYNSIDNVNYANKSLTKGLSEGITSWSKSLSVMDKFKVSLVGILGLSVSMSGMASAMKSVSNEGWNLGNSLQAVASGLGGIASGAYIGSIFGPWGTVIGGVAGAVLELVSACEGYQTETDKIIEKSKQTNKATDDFLKSIQAEKEAIQESLNSSLVMTEAHTTLLSELESIVDANGKVKKGYEERAEYILGTLKTAYGIEYELVNGQISNYETLVDKIKKTIEIKKAEILSDANKEQYANDLKNEIKLWTKKEEAVKSYNSLQKQYNKLREKSLEYYQKNKSFVQSAHGEAITFEEYFQKKINANVDGLKDLQNAMDESELKMNEATNEYTENITRQTQYSDLQQAIMTGNYDKINEAVKKYTNSYIENGEIVQLSLSDRIKKEQESANIILDVYKTKYGNDIPQTLRNSANASLNEVVNGLVSQTKEIKDGNISKELAEAWYTLGNTNKEMFMEKFKELPTNIQQNIINKMYSHGYKISDELQKGIKSFSPTINVKANTSQAEKELDKLLKKINGGKSTLLVGAVASNLKFNANGGIFSNGSWKDIPQYANGGAPSHGTVFVGGENGPEIVGHINGRTEVLNQSQIASAIYSAVVSAMSQFNGGGIAEINIKADEGIIVETAINGINQKTRQTGVCPVDIPIY